ncbi:LppU/SCO3897 family protein [Saccharothrix coeruleofusca]|uniref:Uncharacterized protein n=1 Tax=Saccharothrix coeruleofusca TaxID=33919 RepID=A0A918EBD4_9PSEU|nr:hypothetical protein [Saccharothrix coeruleofusca]MBP2340500.1 hypothetical protein [Saccharothrix coeruleofusca]GGP35006.1 hypothetical protein GCM10010185_02190 [Saccharothrix coeruleofusca]
MSTDDAQPQPGGNRRRGLIAGLAVVAAAAIAFAVFMVVRDGGSLAAGDCAAVQGGASQAEAKPVAAAADCGDDKAGYKVGKVVEGADAACPEEGLYTEALPETGSTTTLCLLPNMVEGACYAPDERGDGFVKSDCAGGDTIKVTKVVQGSTDTTQCPDSAGMSYPEPAVTYCLAPAEM